MQPRLGAGHGLGHFFFEVEKMKNITSVRIFKKSEIFYKVEIFEKTENFYKVEIFEKNEIFYKSCDPHTDPLTDPLTNRPNYEAGWPS